MNKKLKTCLFSALLLAGVSASYAQPTTAAPTPTQDATDVAVLFSDHYTTKCKPEPQPWGGDFAVTKTTIAGTDDAILASQGNSHAVFTTGWEAQKKGTIRIDVWPEKTGKFSFGLGLAFNNNLTWLSGYEWPTVTGGQWNTVEVPFVEFLKAGLGDGANMQCMRFKGENTGKYYIDNIYAYGEKEDFVATVDIPVAPTPTQNADVVTSVFSDTYPRVIKEDPIPVGYAGNIMAKLIGYKSAPEQKVMELAKLSTAGVNISVWNISAYNYIHMDVYWKGDGGEGTAGNFEFGLNSNHWDGKTFEYMQNFYWPEMKAGEWVSIDVPLGEFASMTDRLKMNGIIMMQFKGDGTFYVDNIYAYYQEPEELVPPTDVPTISGLDKTNVKSIFCEQFEDEGYQDSEFGMTDTDANGNLMDYGQNKNQAREFVEIVPGNKTIHLTNWNDYPFKIHKNSTTMDLSDMEYLHFSAYLMSPLDATNKPLTVTLWMHEKEGDQLNPTAAAVPLTPGKWVSFSVPLCHYSEKLDLTKTYVLRFREGGYPAMEVYLDNIFAYKGEPISNLAPDCGSTEEPCTGIFNKEDGKLPPRRQPFLGVNLSSASGGNVPGTLNTDYAMPKMEDLWYFNAKGVKLFRFPFRWRRIQRELYGELNMADINAMKAVIEEAERLGMWVMLDMHDYAEYTIRHNGTAPDTVFQLDGRYKTWISETNQNYGPWKVADEPGERDLRDAFVDVWVKLANEFKDYSNIWGYDLQNEPKGVDLEGLRVCYQRVIDEVRKVDTKAAIVVEGKNFSAAGGWPSNAAGLENLTDPIGNNIIYQAHCYFDSDNSGTYQKDYDTEIKDPKVYKTRLDPFVNWLKEKGKRGMLGEFGVPYNGAEHSDERYMVLIDSVFSYLKQNQLTATIWCAGYFYEKNHLSVSPDKNYCDEKSTMLIMEKYITNFHEGWEDESGIQQPTSLHNNLTVYPNPVTDKVTVQGDGVIETVKVYNLFGQMLLEKQLNSAQGTVDVTELASGNYILQAVQSDGNIAISRITKQ